MKHRIKINLKSILMLLLILNFILNLFILITQLLQMDNMIYTISKIIILLIVAIIFYKKKFLIQSKKYAYLLFIIVLIIILIQGLSIYINNKIMILEQKECNNIKKNIFYHNGYNYYSYCDLSKTIIKIGKKKYTFYEIINIKEDKIDYIVKKLKIEKKKDTKKISVKLNNNYQPVFVKTHLESNYYYYGIENIELLYNGKKYNLDDVDYPLNVENFLKIKKIDNNYNAWYTGKYYNMVACFRGQTNLIDSYIIPNSMKIRNIEKFCKDRVG